MNRSTITRGALATAVLGGGTGLWDAAARGST
jgi:hypothetical protein